MRQPVIVLNWKMNVDRATALRLLRALQKFYSRSRREGEIIVCPSHDLLLTVAEQVRTLQLPVRLGAQNSSWVLAGALTGEISPRSLSRLGCRYVIIGHSERRHLLQESDENVQKKMHLLLGSPNLPQPILCVGEALFGDLQAERFIKKQLDSALRGARIAKSKGLMIAYEPVWAIGSGKPVSQQVWIKRSAVLTATVRKLHPSLPASRITLLYGGSVTADNCGDYENVLVGGASQSPKPLMQLLTRIAHSL